ncbi:MAG: hypothetical protein KME07_02130 [Pegethrix bostrychoides GSE-TBD4-15B]|jgi:hypothetical protein|uniref:Sigma-70 family RNA polymerase sigma factor n=1 Tax=Pegethrix bostrychoides GSE-TBD4-15B TaxID=2839662 RepID=A0A951P7U1_9CYAN|nr:hypothetical protein [Pegethrix bostrychoides GSE-TBD4-15B]
MCSLPEDRNQQLSQLDLTLRQLIEQAQALPPASPARRQLVHRLIVTLLNSGEIRSEGDEIYMQALLETQKWFSRNFHKFDPTQAADPESATVLGWFKLNLYYGLKHPRPAIPPIQFGEDQRVSAEFQHSEGGSTPVWDLLPPETDNSAEAEIIRRERVAAIRDCVASCAVLRSKFVPNRPDLHCQKLLLLRLPNWDSGWLPGASWEDLSAEFGVSRRHLIDCYNKHLTQSCQSCLAQCCRRRLAV